MSRFKKCLLTLCFIAALGFGLGYYLLVPRGPIYEFNEARDTKPILDLFEKDRYLLTATPDYSLAFALKHRAPRKDPRYIGRLKIKVLYEKDTFVGFTAYYLETKDIGRLLFVAVGQEFRSRGFGKQLVRYALEELRRMGAKKVLITTRPSNLSAQKVYRSVGFDEIARDEEFVHFDYIFR